MPTAAEINASIQDTINKQEAMRNTPRPTITPAGSPDTGTSGGQQLIDAGKGIGTVVAGREIYNTLHPTPTPVPGGTPAAVPTQPGTLPTPQPIAPNNGSPIATPETPTIAPTGVEGVGASGAPATVGEMGMAPTGSLNGAIGTGAGYVVPAAIVAMGAYLAQKNFGGGGTTGEPDSYEQQIREEGLSADPSLGVWNQKNTIHNFGPNELAHSAAAYRVGGNFWNKDFTPEEQQGIMQQMIDGGYATESHGEYNLDADRFAALADQARTAKGLPPIYAARNEERRRRSAEGYAGLRDSAANKDQYNDGGGVFNNANYQYAGMTPEQYATAMLARAHQSGPESSAAMNRSVLTPHVYDDFANYDPSNPPPEDVVPGVQGTKAAEGKFTPVQAATQQLSK